MYILLVINIYNHITKFSKNNCCYKKQLRNLNDLSKLSKITFSFVDRFLLADLVLYLKSAKRYFFYKY